MEDSRIACVFVPVVIKSIKDAEAFLKKFSGNVYIPCDDIDINILGNKGDVDVSWRRKVFRGNIFAPYLVECDGARFLYQYRKFVNAWQKAKGGY